ncbi:MULTISPECIES: SH3 domain-containing protein [unclassified Leptolyngbya]|uniref:SH3 domain-containing protein n=1 Tax=unclassified Leptolyngbya TaxID=2650499 RepID=UPI0016835ED3|nr:MULTISPECIES: SH3 domain-containing protein [unclassified Leptolyngbya]MBD1909099.1 hypothetical protein [Leptolyngbya sp. FACHB-8]MBD2158556.1 hypothetical protein [Leptolyngbya sp. FACHB-16]
MSSYSRSYRYLFSGIIAIAGLALPACQSDPSLSTTPVSIPATTNSTSIGTQVEKSPSLQGASPTTTDSKADSSPSTANSVAQASPPTADPYPRRPFGLADIARPGSSFYEFRESLQRAVNERHVDYIRAIAAPDIHLSFGPAMSLDDLDIDNPDSLFWKRLERLVNAPCGPRVDSQTDDMGNPEEWTCSSASEIQQIDGASYDPYTDVFIVGDAINVRMAPSPDSAVMGVLSNEVVKTDPQGFEQLSQTQQQLLETNEGWRPVITPDGKRGFVSSRYAFSPVGYRAFFKNEGQGWFMTVFITGD